MEILSGLEALPDPGLRAPIVTWGVFDGVHRGHRKVLDQVLSWGRADGVSAGVLTFDRPPAEVLRGARVPLISPLGERLRLLGETGLDFCVVLNFTLDFSRLSADRFVREVVVDRLHASGVVLGHDSRFGKDRAGDLASLEAAKLPVRQCEPEFHQGRPVSSSLVRDAIFAGRLDEARYLLGRPPSVHGTAVRGERRGSALGFPTANLELHHAVRPPGGVYAADVPLDGRSCRAVVNIGTRPTFKTDGPEMIEVHLLDWAGGDLYGRALEVRFLARLRDERKFDGLEALRAQIASDVEAARRLP